MAKSKRKRAPKTVLKLPDLEQSKSGVLNSLTSMGALGEVISMHAYIGTKGLRQFRKMEAAEISDPGEFFARLKSCLTEAMGANYRQKAFLQNPDNAPWLLIKSQSMSAD